MNEVYEFQFERRQLTKLVGGLLSLVLLVFCAGALVGVAYQLSYVMPALLAEAEDRGRQQATVPPPVVAASLPAAVADSPETTLEAPAIDPVAPAIDPADLPAIEAPAEQAAVINDETFAVQFGAFLQSQNAGVLARQIAAKGYDADIIAREDSRGRTWYLVRHGAFPNRAKATAAAVELQARAGLDAVVRPANSN
jgi:cell division protein FtsN